MTPSAAGPLELRVLVVAPVGKDAALIASILARDGVEAVTCHDIGELQDELRRGAGALLLAEEALPEHDPWLAHVLGAQPAWSDLPVLLLARSGIGAAPAADTLGALGNVTLLERPMRVSALSSAVRSALRARERQYQIRAHLAERDRADRRKDEFLAMLAHELRNPLAPIRSALDLLRLGRQAPSPAQLEVLERQVAHMVRLVDDLIDVSRMTSGRIQARLEPVVLRAVVDAAIDMSRPLIEAGRHRLAVTPPDTGVVVEADPVRLAQVLSNLLNNAARYTEPGGAIALRTRIDGACAEIAVADSGVGIAPDALPLVFNMFFQGGSARRGSPGLGVGLTLARSIVEMHRGTIHAESPGPGRGSIFTVRLPLAQRAAATAEGATPPRRLAGSPRVLVVDDNRDAAEALAMLLGAMGAEVRQAHDGPEALAAHREFRPQAMFLDIGMSGMDGYEVAERLRAQGGGEPLLLVALTGWGQDSDRRRSREAGFSEHLVKPVGAERLRAVLASLEDRAAA